MKYTQLSGYRELIGLPLKVYFGFFKPRNTKEIAIYLGRKRNSKNDIIEIRVSLKNLGYIKEVPIPDEKKNAVGNQGIYYKATWKPIIDALNGNLKILRIKLTKEEEEIIKNSINYWFERRLNSKIKFKVIQEEQLRLNSEWVDKINEIIEQRKPKLLDEVLKDNPISLADLLRDVLAVFKDELLALVLKTNLGQPFKGEFSKTLLFKLKPLLMGNINFCMYLMTVNFNNKVKIWGEGGL